MGKKRVGAGRPGERIARLGEWQVVVHVSADLPDDQAALVSAMVAAELRVWATQFGQRASRLALSPISITTEH